MMPTWWTAKCVWPHVSEPALCPPLPSCGACRGPGTDPQWQTGGWGWQLEHLQDCIEWFWKHYTHSLIPGCLESFHQVTDLQTETITINKVKNCIEFWCLNNIVHTAAKTHSSSLCWNVFILMYGYNAYDVPA